MLKSISLKNYKCFENLENLEIKPLTILCGVNSSGKSSIINSLLLQKQSYEDNSISNNMKLNGEYAKCGRFRDLALKRNSDSLVTFSTSYELSKPKKFGRSNKKASRYDITAFKNLAKIYSLCNAKSFLISSSISIEQDNEKKSVDNNILAEQRIEISIISSDGTDVKSSIEMKKYKNNPSKYCISLNNIPDGDTGELIEHVELHHAVCYFENFNLINVFSTDIIPEGTHISGLLANIYLIFKMNALQFKNMYYLTPLRGYPKRNYELDYESDDVGLSGEFTPYIMHKYGINKIDGFLPPSSDDKLQESICKFRFRDCVQSWMEYLHFGCYSLSNSSETVQLNVENYNISNVGFGVSQVLPIIVSGLIKQESEFLLLEQPEIHLHPSAQMCMADFLISMAINKKGVIVETHSDHVINRAVRRAMEDKLVRDNLVIYFVDRDADGISSVENVTIDPVRGVLIDNENFFTQFASETEKIIRVGFENKHKEG